MQSNLFPFRAVRHGLIALFALAAANVASAQCVDCAQQMYSATLQNNANSASADVRKLDLKRHDRDIYLRSSTAPRGAQKYPLPADGKAAIASLMPEYARRVKSDGKSGADRWLIESARELGREAGLKARAGAARR